MKPDNPNQMATCMYDVFQLQGGNYGINKSCINYLVACCLTSPKDMATFLATLQQVATYVAS